MRRLLIRPPIDRRESLHGYVGRLAAVNGYSSWATLRRLREGNQTEDRWGWKLGFAPVDIASLVGGCRSDFEQQALKRIDGRQFLLNQMVLDRKMLTVTVRRVCPSCLAENGISDWMWTFRLVTVCLRHHCTLVDVCDRCGAFLMWEVGPFSCRCGRVLAELPVEPTNALEVEVAQRMSAKLSADLESCVVPELSALDQVSRCLHGELASRRKLLSQDRPRVQKLGGVMRQSGAPSNAQDLVAYVGGRRCS